MKIQTMISIRNEGVAAGCCDPQTVQWKRSEQIPDFRIGASIKENISPNAPACRMCQTLFGPSSVWMAIRTVSGPPIRIAAPYVPGVNIACPWRERVGRQKKEDSKVLDEW